MIRIIMISLATISPAIYVSPADTLSQTPCDVLRFTQERDICDHLRGEAPENNEVSATEIEKYCKGTDKKLADLLKKYANKPDILETLSSYETRIESNNN